MGGNPSACGGEDYGQFEKPMKNQVKSTRKFTKSDFLRYKKSPFTFDHHVVPRFPANSSRLNVPPRKRQDDKNAGTPSNTKYFSVHGNINKVPVSNMRKGIDEEARSSINDTSLFEEFFQADEKYFSAGTIIRQDEMSKVRQTSVEETKNLVGEVDPFEIFFRQDDMSKVKATPVEEKKNPAVQVDPFEKFIRQDDMSKVRQTPLEKTRNPSIDVVSFGKFIRQDDMSKVRQTSLEETKNLVVEVDPFEYFFRQDDMSKVKATSVEEMKSSVVEVDYFEKLTLQDNLSKVMQTSIKKLKNPVHDLHPFEKFIRQDIISEVKETKNDVIDVCPSKKSILQHNMPEEKDMKIPVVDECPFGKIILQEKMPEVTETKNNVIDNSTFDKTIQQDIKSMVRETSVKEKKNSAVVVCPFENIFYKFHTDKILTDVILRTDSVLFHVHKLVLCCRSAVFSDMFTADLNAETSQYLDIAEDADTTRRLLLYMYTSEVQAMQWVNDLDLFKAAEKYQLFDLRDKCSIILKSAISRDNFCGILSFANMYHEAELFDAVLDFMSLIPDIFNSEEWKSFKRGNPEIALNTMERIINNFKANI